MPDCQRGRRLRSSCCCSALRLHLVPLQAFARAQGNGCPFSGLLDLSHPTWRRVSLRISSVKLAAGVALNPHRAEPHLVLEHICPCPMRCRGRRVPNISVGCVINHPVAVQMDPDIAGRLALRGKLPTLSRSWTLCVKVSNQLGCTPNLSHKLCLRRCLIAVRG